MHPVASGVDQAFLGALETLQDEWERREIPSPSTVGMCFRRQWFLGRGVEHTERVAPSSILAMERGEALEPLGYALAARAGFIVSPSITLPKEVLRSMNLQRGAIDMLLVKDGLWLGEVKVLGMWSYRLTLLDGKEKIDPLEGLARVHPDYLYQVQLYMEVLARMGFPPQGCIFVMLSADPTAQTWYENNMLRLPEDHPSRLPPITTVVVPRDLAWATLGINRAALVAQYLGLDKPSVVPREYSPWDLDKRGKPKFPCGWCGFRELCMEAG